MKTPSLENLPERKESLWMLAASPLIWSAHFLFCYISAAIWCAKFASRFSSLEPVRWAIAGYTLVALIGIAINGWAGFRHHRIGGEPLPHDLDSPGDRHRFLGFATLLLAGLSAVATVFSALVALIFEDCR